MNDHLPRVNSPAELTAFEQTCASLAGFDRRMNFEYIDGFLCSLAATPTPCEPAEWVEAFFGDTFGRVFADPPSHAQAVRALQARLTVLRSQLDLSVARLLTDP